MQEREYAVATKIETWFIDDLDGSPAEGTIRFALDSTSYEIDVKNRGRIPAELIVKFKAATTQ
jgi:hypothetical protein